VGKLLALWQNKARASSEVKALAREHIGILDQKILELTELRATLTVLVEHCHGDDRPDCPILNRLASGPCCEN
jgi:MerR family copper efflux transcriptional regulator